LDSFIFKGVSVDKNKNEPKTSPFGRKLLSDLREAGDAGLTPSTMKILGAKKELQRLCKFGYAISLDGKTYLSIETYRNISRAILQGRKKGDRLSIADSRNSTGLSRRYLLPILNRMESDGYLERTGDVRTILRTRSIDGRTK
jgi:selenocysteine-specific elongation factor